MTEYADIVLPYPHPGQQHVRRNEQRFNWIAAGRRWRKTTLKMSVAVERACRGDYILWGCPTHKQNMIAWDEFERAVGGVANFHKTNMEITFPGGGHVFLRSLDSPDNARGYTCDGVVLDEAGFIHRSVYYGIIRPMLIDTQGWLWAGGTPNGRNYFYRECMAAIDRPDSVFWQAPTLGVKIIDGRLERAPHPLENPDISFEEILNLFETMPQDLFEQEVLAAFKERSGQVFRNIEPCLTAPHGASPKDHREHRIVAGLDWGKHKDFTALSIGCADCQTELALYRSNQLDYQFQLKRIKAYSDRWKLEKILAERNAMGDPLLEQMERDGLPVEGFDTTAVSKPVLIEDLVLAFEREEWQWLDVPVATGELEAFERKVSKQTGRSSYGAPEPLHDDTIVARALCKRAARRDFGNVIF